MNTKCETRSPSILSYTPYIINTLTKTYRERKRVIVIALQSHLFHISSFKYTRNYVERDKMEIVQKTLANHSFAPILNFLPHSRLPKATVHMLRMLGNTMNTSECGTYRTNAIFYALKSLISKSDPTEM